MASQKLYIGFLVVLIMATGITYVTLNDQARITVGKTQTSFFIHNVLWERMGVETWGLYNGTRLLKPINASVETVQEGDIVTVTRRVHYAGARTVSDVYRFNGSQRNVEFFPTSHEIYLENARGMRYQYKASYLPYSGSTVAQPPTPIILERNMKIEYDTRASSSLTKKGVFTANFSILSNHEVVRFRLFDPVVNESLSGYNGDATLLISFYNAVNNGLNAKFNTTFYFTCGSNECLGTPELTTSSLCAIPTHFSTALMGGTTPTATRYEVRTDMFSETGLILSMSNNSRAFDAWYNMEQYLPKCAGVLPCWANKNIDGTVTQVSSNDTAIDGSARVCLALFQAGNNTQFTASNRTKYRNAAILCAADVYTYETASITPKLTRNGYTVSRLPFSGRNCASSGLSCGTPHWYWGYGGDVVKLFQVAFYQTGNFTYDYAARNLTAAFDGVMRQYDVSDSFGMPCKTGNWNVGGTYLNISCTSSYEWDDAPRATMTLCDALRVANATGTLNGVYLNLSATCLLWANSGTITATSGCIPYNQNGSCQTGGMNNGHYGLGLTLGMHTYYNKSTAKTKLDALMAEYDWTNKGFEWNSGSQNCANGFSFRSSKSLKGFGMIIGLDEASFGYNSSAGGGGEPPAGNVTYVTGEINITLNNPLNGSTVSANWTVMNVTVWNNNISNCSNTSTNVTTDFNLRFNSTFQSGAEDWTGHQATGTDSGDGWINVTNYQTATNNVNNLTGYPNYTYNISFSASIANYTKFFVLSPCDSTNGVRWMLEYFNTTYGAFKADGGSYCDVKFPLNTKINVTLFVKNGTAMNSSNATVYNGATGALLGTCGEQNFGSVVSGGCFRVEGGNPLGDGTPVNTKLYDVKAWNSTGPLIGNVTNTTTICDNNRSTNISNVSFYWANNTLIYSVANVTNGSIVSYNKTGLANGTYGWYVNASTPNDNKTLPNLNFTVNTSAGGGGGFTGNISISVSPSSAELGSVVTTVANISSGTVCIDIDHSSFGTNYACGTGTISANVNFSDYESHLFNDSTTAKNLTYTSSSNKSVGLTLHPRMEIDNLSMSFTGYNSSTSWPSVKVYINGVLSNRLGAIFNSTSMNVNTFNTTAPSITTTFSTGSQTQTVGYIRLPKSATIEGASMKVNGTGGVSYQSSNNGVYANSSTGRVYLNYTKLNGTSSATTFYKKTGSAYTHTYDPQTNDSNTSIPSACWNANTSVLMIAMESSWGSPARFYCANSTWSQDSTNWYNFVSSPGQGVTSFSWCGMAPDTEIIDTLLASSASKQYDSDMGTYSLFYSTGWYTNSHAFPCFSYGSTIYGEGVYWDMFSYNPFVEVGVIDGTREFNQSGKFNTTSTFNITSAIATYLETCTSDSDGYCYVPVYLYSVGGNVTLSNLDVNFTYDINPVYLDVTQLRVLQRSQSAPFNATITIESTTNGTVQLSGVSLLYAGGNSTINFTAHNVNYTATNTTNHTSYYSAWNATYPTYVSFFEFIPKTPTAKNVSAYGQTAATPMLTFRNNGYGGKREILYLMLNETYPCINVSWANTSNLTRTRLTPGTWVNVSNTTYNATTPIWFWANYSCNGTGWNVWRPTLYVRACADGVTCDNSTGV